MSGWGVDGGKCVEFYGGGDLRGFELMFGFCKVCESLDGVLVWSVVLGRRAYTVTVSFSVSNN